MHMIAKLTRAQLETLVFVVILALLHVVYHRSLTYLPMWISTVRRWHLAR
jgi:hypothetical protein